MDTDYKKGRCDIGSGPGPTHNGKVYQLKCEDASNDGASFSNDANGEKVKILVFDEDAKRYFKEGTVYSIDFVPLPD